MKRLSFCLLAVVATTACKSTNASQGSAAAGAGDELQVSNDGDRIPDDWDAPGGREYWLYTPAGKNAGNTFDDVSWKAKSETQPLYVKQPGDVKVLEEPVTEAARRCMKRSSDNLVAIQANPPQWYTDFMTFTQEQGVSFSWYGWLNDYSRTTQASEWQEPFNWTGYAPAKSINQKCYQIRGYLKWVSSLDAQGKCKAPTAEQLEGVFANMKSRHLAEAANREADTCN